MQKDRKHDPYKLCKKLAKKAQDNLNIPQLVVKGHTNCGHNGIFFSDTIMDKEMTVVTARMDIVLSEESQTQKVTVHCMHPRPEWETYRDRK